MKTRRIERVFRLIQALQSGRALSAEDLAEMIGASRRTVFRDLNLITRAGLPYTYDRDTKKYWVERVPHLPPLSLSYAEALAMMIAARFLLGRRFIPNAAAATSAALKLESLLPRDIRAQIDPLLAQTQVRDDPMPDSGPLEDTISLLQQAAARHLKVQARYDSYSDRKALELTLHPHRVVYMQRAWYVIAFSEDHGETRTLKVDRLLELQVLRDTFRADPFFRLDDYLGNAWSIVRGERRFLVRIRFLPQVANYLEEIIWHKTQRTHREVDGSLIFEASVDGVNEIAWWVLGYGDQAQVLEPPELRALVRGHAERMSQYYQQSPIAPHDAGSSE